jgi:hypothetical protein
MLMPNGLLAAMRVRIPGASMGRRSLSAISPDRPSVGLNFAGAGTRANCAPQYGSREVADEVETVSVSILKMFSV